MATTPEELHDVAKNIGKKQVGTEKFVNPGVPEGALVNKEDLPNAEVSKKATNDLRENLIKD